MAKDRTKKEELKVEADAKKEEPEVESKSTPAESSPKKIKVTPEQLQKLQAEGKLIGWNPATGEALIN